MGVIRWAWASLIANIVIVLTGGLVRLTGSGLGCPTWPRCTPTSFVPHRALGIHGAIEFGNRMLTYVLVAVAVGTLVAVWRSTDHRRSRRLALLLAAGIPLQGVLGGITVLTHLNPWIVSLHMVVSMGLIGGAVLLIRRVSEAPVILVSRATRAGILLTFVAAILAIYLGTILTGSGPHAGDASAPRNGLDPMMLTEAHSWAVVALVLLTLWSAVALRRTPARRWALLLLAVEAVQACVGIVQYTHGLPIHVVAEHLLGAALVMTTATNLLVRTRPTLTLRPGIRTEFS